MGQVLIQIVANDRGEVSLEYMADMVRLLPPEEIVKPAGALSGRQAAAVGLPCAECV